MESKFWMIFAAVFALASIHDATAAEDVLPDYCDNVVCPHFLDIKCPEDSDIRLLDISHNVMTPSYATNDSIDNSINTDYTSEQYNKCCLNKKCICRTCRIRDCKPHEVAIVLREESMEQPGQCCGEQTCGVEPNCSEIHNTSYKWLIDCKSCECIMGKRICHEQCSESLNTTVNAGCFINGKSYKHGEKWTDKCEDCECWNGQDKCVTSFCKSDCPIERRVVLKNECCPVCWPECDTMPFDNFYDESEPEEEAQQTETVTSIGVLPNIDFNETETGTIIDTTSSSSSYSSSTTSSPAYADASPFQNNPKQNVVDMADHNSNNFWRTLAIGLGIVLGFCTLFIIYLVRKLYCTGKGKYSIVNDSERSNPKNATLTKFRNEP